MTLLACLDLCPVAPMLNTFDYALTEDERREHPAGSLTGKKLSLALTEAKPDFGGRLRFRGLIIGREAPKN